MQERQKILFISAVAILTMIALLEGVILLRNSPRWEAWTSSVSKTLHALVSTKTDRIQKGNALTEKEGIILQETAEDLERMQNQINRLFYEMIGTPPFARQNNDDRQKIFYPQDNMQRLQAEIAHVFQRAYDSRHNNALHLIEQDWYDVGEISSMNIEEDKTNYIIAVSMPGFNKTDITINLSGRVLTVQAERRQSHANSPDTHSSHFETQIMLPDDIAGESARAFYDNSTLKITIPREPLSNSLAHKITIR